MFEIRDYMPDGFALRAAARAAADAAYAANLSPQINDMAIDALRCAIEAGPHGGFSESSVVETIRTRRAELAW